MVLTRIGRHAAALSTSAGAAWTSLSLLSILTPEPARYLDVLFVVPYALSLGGVLGLHAVQRAHTRRLERLGMWTSVVGMIATLVGQIGIITDADPLIRIVLPPGVAAWLLGFLIVGIVTARARVLPAWTGVVLALAQPLAVGAGLALSPISPLSATGDYTGAIAHGLVWLALGAALRAHGRATTRAIALRAA